jgi:hypothetical protein
MTPDSFSRRTRCGRGQPGQSGEFDIGAVRIFLQRGQQLDVNFVK